MVSLESKYKPSNFLYYGQAYPVEWAEGPLEVPPWDVSRGFPLRQSSGNLSAFEKAHLEAHFRLETLEHMVRNANDHMPTLGGSENEWLPEAPPEEDYPRLVRKDYCEPVLWHYQQDEDIINELAAVAFYVDRFRENKPQLQYSDIDIHKVLLRRRVKHLAEKYGHPYSEPHSNSLSFWLRLVARVYIHLFALYHLTQNSDPIEMIEALNEWQAVVDESLRYRSNFDPLCQEEDYELEYLARLALNRNNARAVRTAISNETYQLFGKGVESSNVTVSFRPKGIILRCYADQWVYFKLSELWGSSTRVKRCRVCRMLFARTRKNQIYCKNGSCASKKKDSEKNPQRKSKQAHSMRVGNLDSKLESTHRGHEDRIRLTGQNIVYEYGASVFDVCDRYDVEIMYGSTGNFDMQVFDAINALCEGKTMTTALSCIEDGHPGSEDVRKALKALLPFESYMNSST